MKWVADESVDHPSVEALRAAGHDVWAVAEQAPGLRDEAVLAHAMKTDAMLITADKDFGELVFRRRMVTAGVLLIRLSGLGADAKVDRVVTAVHRHGAVMREAFSVVDRGGLRIRRRQ